MRTLIPTLLNGNAAIRLARMVFLVSILISGAAWAGDLSVSDCNAQRSVPVTLSSVDRKDILKLTAIGSPCLKGNIVVTIARDDGTEIYRQVAKIVSFYVDPCGVPSSDVEHLLDSIVHDVSMTTGSWPRYVAKWRPDVEGEYSYAVPRSEFDKWRRRNAPALRLWLHHDVYTNIVYDSNKDKAVAIWEWSL